MTISDATVKAMETIAQRQRDVADCVSWKIKAPQDAFFIARDRDATVYERETTLALHDGTLVDGSGRPVFGFDGAGTAMHQLRADTVDIALGFTGSLLVAGDGSIVYDRLEIDPRTGEQLASTQTIGQLALARFPSSATPRVSATGEVWAPQGVTPLTGTPGDKHFGAMSPSTRAQGRLDTGFERLQDAYMAFEALGAAHKAAGSVEKTAMDLLK